MAADRATIEAEVTYLLGNRDDQGTEVTRWVKRAYQAITQRVEFPEAFATPVTRLTSLGIRNYSLPTDYFSIYGIRNATTDKKVIQASPVRYLAYRAAEVGSAEFYAIMNDEFHIHRTPDSTVETLYLYYRKIFPSLDLSSSVHELKDAWDEPIIWEAASYGYDALGEPERSILMQRRVRGFIAAQTPVLEAELIDRDEAIQVLGL
jgi:hypothetical protein